ncbi:N-acetyltransferase [Listeria sp. SHR_NRA_18]|uniref:GNAT family N-acetyltransferase n=1 Tax=Listeria TaxID=1637 RepID=UPI00051CCA80|nr:MULTISPECIES: GNAT family N-acetyltransferase [Listeria]KGL41235.1 GNAT family acetyltraansferase [Listeriaceae bacterium FSL A5-0209]RQW67417.1 N-acetyltransferase [Listeria sp. SHR_NRA_18]
MEFVKGENRFFKEDEDGKLIAEVTWVPSGDSLVILDHTFVDESLRGQGIASQLVEKVAETMRAEGKKITATCPFAKAEFERKPEKYDDVKA